MIDTESFVFKFTAETLPFHVFQAFNLYRKSKFQYWNLHKWCAEIGIDNKNLLQDVLRGKALPCRELTEKLLDNMKVDQEFRKRMCALIEARRMKEEARRVRHITAANGKTVALAK